MRLKQYINEEYLTRVKGIELFKNPSIRELKNIDYIRFSADNKNKTIYAWDADETIHNTMWDNSKEISKNRNWDNCSCKIVLHGVAEKKGSKLIMISSDEFEWRYDAEEIEADETYETFKWMNNKIKIDKYFKEFL